MGRSQGSAWAKGVHGQKPRECMGRSQGSAWAEAKGVHGQKPRECGQKPRECMGSVCARVGSSRWKKALGL